MKLWQTDDSLDPLVESFMTGLDPELDLELVPYDCTASMAHVAMLASVGIISSQEEKDLTGKLEEIKNLHAQGKFRIDPDQEDGHTAIEMYLVQALGDTGKKVHTGRSRNDQVLTALRLLERDKLDEITREVNKLAARLKSFAGQHESLPIPGYTHTRKAMPFTVGQWAMAYHDALQDDLILMAATREVLNQNPLGTGAGYGIPLPLDRQMTSQLLGFSGVMKNPLYAQNSRGKFEARVLQDCMAVLYDLNKLASDLILFTLPELGYFSLSQSLMTGSSIMPHKQNPDVLELIRASWHQVAGFELQSRNIPVNLISGYHRDLQLTKEPLLRSLKITRDVLAVSQVVMNGLEVNPGRLKRSMTEEMQSVQKVMELVNSGMTFRDAYHRVSELFRRNKDRSDSPD